MVVIGCLALTASPVCPKQFINVHAPAGCSYQFGLEASYCEEICIWLTARLREQVVEERRLRLNPQVHVFLQSIETCRHTSRQTDL